MRTLSVLSPECGVHNDVTNMDQSRNKLGANNDNDSGPLSSMHKRKSSKNLLSSLVDSASSAMKRDTNQGNLDDWVVLPATSSCSVETEYGYNNQVVSDESREDHEGLDEWCSITTEVRDDREGSESCTRHLGVELKRERSTTPPISIAVKKVVGKIVKRAESDEASKSSKSSKGSTRSKKSAAVKKVVQKIVKREGSDRSVKDFKAKKTVEVNQTKPPLIPKTTSCKQKKKQKEDKAQQPAAVKNATASISKPPAPSDDHWTGRIVGLRLPSNIDSAFDTKSKPTDRRVDPSKFLASMEPSIEKKTQDVTADWDPWKKRNDSTNIALDIYLSNANDTSSKPIKIHMIRDPSEDVSKTLQRLQLSVQKKIGGKKKKTKKGKKAEAGSKQGDEATLWREKIQDNNASAVQPADYENEAMACTTFWDGFFDTMLPINACNPWNLSNQEDQQSLADKFITPKKNVESPVGDGTIMEGYERVHYSNSLTIDDVLQQAANMADFGRYALSVPITSNNTTSWTPLIFDSCLPTLTSVSTFGSFNESHLFERTPLVVEVGLLYATKAQITWFADGEQVCANTSCYTPTKSDLGKVLSVVIIPQRSDHDGKGCEEAYQFKRRVEALPPMPVMTSLREDFLNRPKPQLQAHQQHFHDVQSKDDDPSMSLRVVTYNILADQNASRDVDKDDDADRMYSHCKNEHIVKWRRMPLIVHELLEYCPDVISLQEVDNDVFAGLLKPILNAKGFEGYFSQKGVGVSSGVQEGCAIFWSLDVFESVRPVDMRTHTFRKIAEQFSCEKRLHKRQWKSLNDMSDLLDKHDHLKHVLFNKLGHVMQTVVLTQRKSQEKVVIGNTHLFYHPMASHIRCLKMLMACRQLEIEHKENQHCPIIFCGDLNSHPNSGVMKLMLNRYLESNNGKTWKHLCTYEWEEGASAGLHHNVEAIDLEFPASFPGLMSAYPEPPDFTHFIEAFICTLDYILVTENFELVKSAATPTREDVEKLVAMPNEFMPSDHVSLVCDLKWR